MNEEEIIKICKILCGRKNKKGKREYALFSNLQLQLDYSTDEIAEAIEGLLDLYTKEKEKNDILQKELYKKVEALDKAVNNLDYINKKIRERYEQLKHYEYIEIKELLKLLEK